MATAYQEPTGEYAISGAEINRQDIQAAIAKAVELRAIHAALVQGSSPGRLLHPSASPASHHVSQFSAQDYPVFTPVISLSLSTFTFSPGIDFIVLFLC